MAETTQKLITASWMEISAGDCTLQAVGSDSLYNVYIGTEPPSDSFLVLSLLEPATFAYKTAVWVRLDAKGNAGMSEDIIVIQ